MPISEKYRFAVMYHCLYFNERSEIFFVSAFPSPAISSRDRPSVVNLPSDEIFYSTFVAFNQFLVCVSRCDDI